MDPALLARVAEVKRALKLREGWKAERIAAHQVEQVRQLRAHAMRHSPFYREFHRGFEDAPLHDLPVLTKTELMNHFDEVVTDPVIRLAEVRRHLDELTSDELFLGKYRITRTSGSTGHPGVFLSDTIEWATILGSYARGQEWAGIAVDLKSSTRLAVVGSRVPWHQSARVGASVDSPFLPVKRLDSTQPLEIIVSELNAWQPASLIAYPSLAKVLADEQIGGRLSIHPRTIMSTSEVLSEETRVRIRHVWGCEPFDVYATSESASIAAECPHHRLHFFDDLLVTEVVDEANRPVPSGQFGAKLLMTVLFSRTQPLIRYVVSDRVMVSPDRCDCGLAFGVLGAIEGRDEELLPLPSPAGQPVAIHPNVFHTVLAALPVETYQVIEETDAIRILLARPSGEIDTDRVSSAVVRAIERQGAVPCPVLVERVDVVSKTATGKTPLIKTKRMIMAP
jgi:phenylacetate-CoA ligase